MSHQSHSLRGKGMPKIMEPAAPKLIQQYRRRASAELAGQLRNHSPETRYTLMACFCFQRAQDITDSLVELLIQIIHRLSLNAERRVERELISNFKRVHNKEAILYRIAEAALANPDQPVKSVIYPVASPEKLTNLIEERKRTGATPTVRKFMCEFEPPTCTTIGRWFRRFSIPSNLNRTMNLIVPSLMPLH